MSPRSAWLLIWSALCLASVPAAMADDGIAYLSLTFDPQQPGCVVQDWNSWYAARSAPAACRTSAKPPPKEATDMRVALRIALITGLIIAGGGAALAEPRVSFEDNRLQVDGEPFFIYGCWGTPEGDYAEFRRRHFNTAFLGWRASETEGPLAAEAGLMVIPYPYAPGWSDQVKAAMEAIADEDWVLAWNIGDDLHKQEHIEAALRVRDEMRAIDPQNRPIMFDAIGMYEDFASIPDMWCAYAYALVRPAAAAPPARKPLGMREYGDWLNRMRLLGRPDGFFWTWAQCHVQIWYSNKYLGGTDEDKWCPSAFPDGDHLRLIAAHAISAGSRGMLWFVKHYFEDGHLGRDRYARASIIGCELSVVGPLIAQGRTADRLATSDPSVWATPIDFPGGRLICLIKTGDRYNYQPDAARVEDVRVETGAEGRIFQIGHEFTQLQTPECSFDLTGWLLVTDADDIIAQVRARHEAALPDMAEFAVEELAARLAKGTSVFAELGEGEAVIAEVQTDLDAARRDLAAENWSTAARAADAAITDLRAEQHRVWRETFSDDVLDMGIELTDFYLLPGTAGDIALLKQDAWGDNQLANGAFETDDGWAGAALAHDTSGKTGLVAGAGREGSRALRLASDSPTIYNGNPQDWVTANVVSGKIAASPGEVWEIAAWVRVPEEMQQTARGITIALYAHNTEGDRIPGYGAQALEATQVDATDGWKQVRLLVQLRSPQVASIAARLAVCGVGEAYLDDVTVRRLQRPDE